MATSEHPYAPQTPGASAPGERRFLNQNSEFNSQIIVIGLMGAIMVIGSIAALIYCYVRG